MYYLKFAGNINIPLLQIFTVTYTRFCQTKTKQWKTNILMSFRIEAMTLALM